MKAAVLIVDDSEFFREALAGALASDPELEVLKARNGREALDILSRPHRIKALVLDVSTPILGGREVLKALGGASSLPLFVVVTGSAAERQALEECLALGAHETLVKPLEAERLGHLLRQGMSRTSQAVESEPTSKP